MKQNSEMLFTESRWQQPSCQQHFPQVPNPPPQPNVRHFSGQSRKRQGITGREMAKAAERNKTRQRRMTETNQWLLALEAKEREVKARMEAARRALAETKAVNETDGTNIYSQSIEAAAEDSSEEAPEYNNEPNNDDDNKPSDKHHDEPPPPSSRRSTQEIRKTKKLLSQQQQKELTAAKRAKPKEGKKPAIKPKKIKQVSQFEDLLN